MRRIASSLVIAVLFLSMFVFAFNVQTARAQGIININPDGSIISPAGITANITNSGNVTYTFTGNNYLPIVVGRSNIIINGMGYTLQASGGYGFTLTGMSNVTIKNTTITKSLIGIFLNSSSSNVLSGNNVTANSEYGIELEDSNDNTLSGDSFTANGGYGIYLSNSSGNVLSGNDVTANSRNGGVCLENSSGNFLSGNMIAGNINVGIDLYSSSGNVLSGNVIAANNYYGINLESSSGNTIFNNDFLINPQQAVVSNSTNTWDDGYPSGGNYWSNYRTRYPNAAKNDSSAIWNTPYVIDSNNTDRHPLMGPFHTFGVGILNGTAYSVDTICNSTITDLSFNATLRTLTFNVTGTNGTVGFCRVTIPLSLMSGEWTVTVNGTQLLPPILNITTYGNYTYIYFTYHHSTETVQITGTTAIPELQPFMLLPLFMIITMLGAMAFKKHTTRPSARAKRDFKRKVTTTAMSHYNI